VRTPALVLTAAFLGSALVSPPSSHACQHINGTMTCPQNRALIPLFQLHWGASGLKGWIATIGSDPAAIVFVVGVVLLIVLLVSAVFAARARRQRERQREAEWRMAPESADEIGIARWVEEGRHLLNHWQERIERLDELQSRLAAMAQEIGQLKAQASRM
jgi:hypothetical protein